MNMRFLIALLASVMLLWGEPAGAQTSARTEAKATELSAIIFSGEMFDALMTHVEGEFRSSFGAEQLPTAWEPLFVAAMREEMALRRPELIVIFGRYMFSGFTEAELDVGLQLMRLEGARKVFIAGAAGGPTPTLTRQEERELERVYRMPGGSSFIQKMARIDTNTPPESEEAMVRLIVPGMMRRFGEKAEAYERARTAR